MNHQPRKRFGQNFLIDHTVIERILAALKLQPQDPVVEIGPGLGAITLPLLEQLDTLHVVEIDRDLIARFRQRNLPGLVVHEADALALEWSSFLPDCAPGTLRIVGNLPYNIGTPLLLNLLDARHRIRDVHVMLQKEVVNRLVASNATRTYGRLSVMMQSCFIIESLIDVPPSAFDPQPKVDSAVVRLNPRADAPDNATLDALSRAARLAFANKRKTLRNNMKGVLNDSQLQAAGLDPQARAETLDQRSFLALARLLGPPS